MGRYKPPKHSPEGSWAEIFMMTRVAFEVLAGPMLVICGFLALAIFGLWALIAEPILVLIPIVIITSVIVWIVRRDRVAQKTLEEELLGPGRRL